MRSASILSSISAVVLAGAFFACATGGDASNGDTSGIDTNPGTDTDSGVTTDPVMDVDSGNHGFVPKDSGTSGKDSGGGGGKDSGGGGGTDSGGGGTKNDDCVGTQGMQLMQSYSSECTGGFNFGVCKSGNGDCIQAAIDQGTPGPLCCFIPKSTSTCGFFFGPSCVPQ